MKAKVSEIGLEEKTIGRDPKDYIQQRPLNKSGSVGVVEYPIVDFNFLAKEYCTYGDDRANAIANNAFLVGHQATIDKVVALLQQSIKHPRDTKSQSTVGWNNALDNLLTQIKNLTP